MFTIWVVPLYSPDMVAYTVSVDVGLGCIDVCSLRQGLVGGDLVGSRIDKAYRLGLPVPCRHRGKGGRGWKCGDFRGDGR